MAEHADALVLSLGTPAPDRLEAMLGAGRRAAARGCPIVVDPVGAGSTEFRDTAARRLLDALPVTVIRANLGEAEALLGRHGWVRGVESAVEGQAAGGGATARQLARARGCVAAVTGPVDHVAGGDRLLVVEHGHPWLEAVSGAGCMVSALVGAFIAVGDDRLNATAAALTCFGLAAELASRRAAGPGTLVPHLLDALYHVVPEDLRHATRTREC
jgi:hydroxyethylthiazole kinase